jgi:hypothetical protein
VFDVLAGDLVARKMALEGTTDKVGKKEYAAAKSVLAKLDKLNLSAKPSLGLDIATAAAIIPPLTKGFPDQFPKPPGVLNGSVASGVTAAIATLKGLVETAFNDLSTAVGGLADGKTKTAATKQKDVAAAALGAADTATTPLAVAKLLAKANAAIAKAQSAIAKAPKVDVVTATIGGVAYKGQNNYIDYAPTNGSFVITSNGKHPQGFLSFDLQPFMVNISAPGDYPGFNGHLVIGADPITNTQYYIQSATIHVTAIDVATKRCTGSFEFVVQGHPELNVTDGKFDIFTMRLGN